MGQQQSHTPTITQHISTSNSTNASTDTKHVPANNQHIYTKMTKKQYQDYQQFLQQQSGKPSTQPAPGHVTNVPRPSSNPRVSSTPISKLPIVNTSRVNTNVSNNSGKSYTKSSPSTSPAQNTTVTSQFSKLQQERIYSQPNSTYHPQPRMDVVLQQKGQLSNVKDQYQNVYQQRQFDANSQYYNTLEYHGQVNRQRDIFETSQNDMVTRRKDETIRIKTDTSDSVHNKSPIQPKQIPNNNTSAKSKYRKELDSFSDKYDAHALLGIVKGAPPKEVERAYRRQAMKVHPDRGGSQEAFTLLTKAYLSILEDLKAERSSRMNYGEMKQESQDYIDDQGRSGPAPLGSGQGFDRQKFNQLFDETRLDEVVDEGYSEWIKQTPTEGRSSNVNSGHFSDKFSLKVFNSTFENQRNIDDEIPEETGIVNYSEPIAAPITKINFTELGQNNISDFGKVSSIDSSKSLGYTDYKQAMTNTHLLNQRDRNTTIRQYQDVDELEKDRESISYEMDSTQQSHYNQWKDHETKLENMRQERLRQRDSLVTDRFQEVQRTLLGSEYKCLTGNTHN